MKKVILSFMLSLLTINLFCQTNTNIDELVNKNSFKFKAEKVIASGRKQNMVVTNSGNSVARSVNLNQEFFILMDDKNLTVNLPNYQNQIDQSQGASLYNFEFNSKKFKLSKKQLARGGWIITIKPFDVKRIRSQIVTQIVIKINQSGKATSTIYLDTNGPDNTREFEGYIADYEI